MQRPRIRQEFISPARAPRRGGRVSASEHCTLDIN